MFGFLKIGVFRRKYLVYVVALFVLCMGLCVGVCAAFLSARAAALRQDALTAFERAESNITSAINSIEAYVLRIYRTNGLAEDMENIIGSSMEDYLSGRLSSEAPGGNIVDSIHEFGNTAGAVSYSQISLYDAGTATVFNFSQGHIDTSFFVPAPNGFEPNIAQGYTYARPLASPDGMANTIGEMVFIMTPDSVFAPIKQYDLPNVAAMDDFGNCYVVSGDDAYSDEVYQSIVEQGYGQGIVTKGMGRVYFSVNTSSAHGYRLVLAYNIASLIRQNRGPVIIMLAGTLLTYLLIMLIITLNMRQDAEFLLQIIGSIDKAKTASFHPISRRSAKRNEYGMIADSLNDMSKKLAEYIRTEYLLKLRQQEAEMKALQHQINPHFLYNTLEIIRSAAVVNHDDRVADAITNLGQIYRSITRAGTVVSLQEELDILNAYLELMSFRYNGSFSYRTEIAPELAQVKTVKFWMQPIAENFFAHGYDTLSEFNLFMLSGAMDENGWSIEMMDNGPGIAPHRLEELNRALVDDEEPGREGIGLRNVFLRLRYYYGSAFSMDIRNNPDAGITVTIHVAKEGAEEHA